MEVLVRSNVHDQASLVSLYDEGRRARSVLVIASRLLDQRVERCRDGLITISGALGRATARSPRGRVERMSVDTRAMSDRLRHVRITAADGNQLVEVTIDATGRLVDLRLGDRNRRVAPEVVSRTVMKTIAVAAG